MDEMTEDQRHETHCHRMAETLYRLAAVYRKAATDREAFQGKQALAFAVIRDLVADWI